MVVPYVEDAAVIILGVAGIGLLLSAIHVLVVLFRKQHFLPRDKELRRKLARTQTAPNPKPQRLRKPTNRPPPPQFFYVDIEAATPSVPPPSSAAPSEPPPSKDAKPKPAAVAATSVESRPNDRGLSIDDEFILHVKRDLALYEPPNMDTQALKLKVPQHHHGRLQNCRRPQYLSDVPIDPALKEENDDISLVSDDKSEVDFSELDPEGKRTANAKSTSKTLLKLLAMPAELEDAPTTEQEREVKNVVITAKDTLFLSLRNTKMK